MCDCDTLSSLCCLSACLRDCMLYRVYPRPLSTLPTALARWASWRPILSAPHQSTTYCLLDVHRGPTPGPLSSNTPRLSCLARKAGGLGWGASSGPVIPHIDWPSRIHCHVRPKQARLGVIVINHPAGETKTGAKKVGQGPKWKVIIILASESGKRRSGFDHVEFRAFRGVLYRGRGNSLDHNANGNFGVSLQGRHW